MINFRFHIISIVAIFLALGIGIIMGSTVIDRAIVDGLRSRIDVAEANSVKRKDDNDRLQDEAKLLNEQDTILSGHSVRDYLTNQNVYVLVVGEVSDELKTEVVELSSAAGGQISSVIQFNDDFVKQNKTKLLDEYLKTVTNKIPASNTGESEKVLLNYFENALNVSKNSNADTLYGEVDYPSFLSFLESKSAYNETNIFQNPVLKLNTSFLLLVDRSKLAEKEYVSFVANLQNQFPCTIGLVGSDDPKELPSRSDSVDKLAKKLTTINLVDNAESPSGRTSLIIAHKDYLAGKASIYGVSSKAKERAPSL